MILFDPTAVSAPVGAVAEAVQADSGAAAVVAQVTRGALSAGAAAGVSDLETGTPADAQQSYEIGSQTKMMTAVMVLQLVEEGLVDLDAPAAQYLPAETVAGIANADTATVRQLLDMTSGIGNYTDATDADGVPLFIAALRANPETVFGPAEALEIARDMEATGAPGEAYVYSNTNYVMLGQMIENLTGQTFFDALQLRILTPLGMTDTVPQLAFGDARLSSYLLDPSTGEPVDVTYALWETRGEGGVVSTAADMTTFLQGLLVEKSLLGPEALAEMMEFRVTSEGGGGTTNFGLGLVEVRLVDGTTAIGFTGGTLGTASSTYLDTTTGTIVAAAATSPDVDSAATALGLLEATTSDASWNPMVDDGSPVVVAGVSAAQVDVHQDGTDLTIAAGSAELALDRELTAQTTSSVTFADGSVLVVGDNTVATAGDDRGNRIDIARDHSGAETKDNQLLGLGGNDRLAGAAGNDRLDGGDGNDRLIGRDGNDHIEGGRAEDRLHGGAGDDILSGGAGRDLLTGGAGADTFVFRSADESHAGRGADRITDFATGQDKIDLSAIHVGDDGAGFTWIALADFSGTAGELRYDTRSGGVSVQADIDGDGHADMAIHLSSAPHLVAEDFIL